MHLHLVDGTYELFRAYYGAPRRKDPDGVEIGAVRGLLHTLLSLVRHDGASHVAVAFDHVIESFRNQLFAGYKTGQGLEPELLAQFGPAEDAARALGMVVWSMVEFEADDALASGAARFARDPRVTRIHLCTPDKDLAQCVVGKRVVGLDRRRGLVLDQDGVRTKFGVEPRSIPDWLALVGDRADGIPGIPRWGARSASAVLGEYGHIDRIPDDQARWRVRVRGATGLAESLRARRDEAALYLRLATLRTDVPLDERRVEDLEWRGARREALEALARRCDDERLPRNVPRWREQPAR